jgi:hypothetical protein
VSSTKEKFVQRGQLMQRGGNKAKKDAREVNFDISREGDKFSYSTWRGGKYGFRTDIQITVEQCHHNCVGHWKIL